MRFDKNYYHISSSDTVILKFSGLEQKSPAKKICTSFIIQNHGNKTTIDLFCFDKTL